jgi:cytidylate kinase
MAMEALRINLDDGKEKTTVEKDKVIITICRTCGSQGQNVGDKIAERLHVKCYNREILTEAIRRNGMSEAVAEEYYSSMKSSFLGNLTERIRVEGKDSPAFAMAMQLYKKEYEIINEIADRESCVFVGRYAYYALRNRAHLVSVFLDAPLEYRVQNVMQMYALCRERAEEFVRNEDVFRSSYYNGFTDLEWGDRNNYNLFLDVKETGIDKCVTRILEYIQEH